MLKSQTISILFWLYKSKIRNGKAPIYCRVTVNGKRVELSTGKFIVPDNWDGSNGKVKGKSEEARSINHYLMEMEQEIHNKAKELDYKKEYISGEKIKNLYKGIAISNHLLLEIFKSHNDKMKEKIGIDVAKGTHTKFETVYNKLKEFIKLKYIVKDIAISDLNNQFVVDFEHFLKVKKKIGANTTMKYIQALKKILNQCVANDLLVKNPFQNFKCSLKKVEREVLTDREILKIRKKNINIQRLSEVRDVFLFCCYTGLSFIDVMNLTEDEVLIGIDGNKWIFTSRQKTGNNSNVPLLPQALEILNHYQNHDCRVIENKLLPVKSNQKMNAYLKEIADICEITKTLTMHIARHTFATTITLSNGVPIETVSKMLGHTKLATTQIYAKVLENKVSDDMEVLRKKLAKTTKQKVVNS